MALSEMLEGAFWERPRFSPIDQNVSVMLEGPAVAKY